MRFLSLLGASALLLAPVFSQTFTDCNPLNTTCPQDPAFGINHTFVFNTSTTVTNSFNITNGALTYGSNGAEFTVNKRGDSPTIKSQFYIFWGSVSVVMKAASGQGIISSIVLESDDLDEVDWEFMGGNSTHAETNYFGKGNTTSFDRAFYYPVASSVLDNFHNYSIHWTSEKLEWYIDGALVRTLPYAAANNGNNYPQTPMTVRLGVWAGGDPDNNNGTIEWAGGLTDFTKGPYTMYVQSAEVNDFSTGKAYEYGDKSGSWQSIKTIAGTSAVNQTIVEASTPHLSMAQKFQALPSSTKMAIYGGGGAAAALLFGALLFTCIRQRRKGRQERDAYNAKIEKEREEAYRDQMELREKGLGGWDRKEFDHQGEDALGGWGGSYDGRHSTLLQTNNNPPAPKFPGQVSVNEVPSRSNSPAFPRVVDPVARMQTPSLASPQPQSPRATPAWNGGNQSGLIQNAGNAYSGGYGGNTNIPRSPSFPLSPQVPQQRGYPGGYNNNAGYSRF